MKLRVHVRSLENSPDGSISYKTLVREFTDDESFEKLYNWLSTIKYVEPPTIIPVTLPTDSE